MWDKNWRTDTWRELKQQWDIIVIGGGITGAGIFNMAARRGYRVLLLEASDFSFGTTSRSSKLVHGGLRYLKNNQFDVVRESVRERERMIRQAPGLVHKLGFLFAGYSSFGLSHHLLAFGTCLYDLMVPKWDHRTILKDDIQDWEPMINRTDLTGAVHYFDACVDDSRLLLRILQDGQRAGGTVLNYSKVVDLLRNASGRVVGVRVQDQSGLLSPTDHEIQAKVVVNATGPWSDEVRAVIQGKPKLRKLLGSHLIFSHNKLPIRQAVTMLHPRDHRALFAIPWEGVTMIGTTDLDQKELPGEPKISSEEVEYLLQAANFAFPDNQVSEQDIISTFAGIRPVIDTGAATPSKESRAHKIWEEDGLVSISGGKLTIFRVMAADLLNFISRYLPNTPHFDHKEKIFDNPLDQAKPSSLSETDWSELIGRHGQNSATVLEYASEDQWTRINPLSNLWVELPYASSQEAVVHLDDVLLRRVRLGLCLPNGGLDMIEKIRSLVQARLGWSDEVWEVEVQRYRNIWHNYYYLP